MAVLKSELIPAEIREPMGRLRDAVRTFQLKDAFLSTLLFLVCYFWIALVLDYGFFQAFGVDWVQDAPRFFRKSVFLAVMLGWGIYLTWRWLIPLTKSLNEAALAIVLEKKFANRLQGRLITAIELADLDHAASYGYSREFIQDTTAKVCKEIEDIAMEEVINFDRLQSKRRWLFFLLLTPFVLWLLAILVIRGPSLGDTLGRAVNTSLTWYDRNVKWKYVPWPRNIHLELPEYTKAEIRIGKENASPRLRAIAYKWVVADRRTEDGWRPLKWADLSKFVEKDSIPQLPGQTLSAQKQFAEVAPALIGGFATLTRPPLIDDSFLSQNEAEWSFDRVEQLFIEATDSRAFFRQLLPAAELEKLENLFTRIDQMADSFRHGRQLRKLEKPEKVRLNYWGERTRVEMDLTSESDSDFVGVMSDLRESIDFRVRSRDYVSSRKKISLVLPPQLIDFQRTELRPAYIYHVPPYDSNLPPLLVNPAKLVGKKQVVDNLAISLVGDRSRLEFPAGTEFRFFGRTDRPITRATLQPKPGRFPGVDADAGPTTINLALSADMESFEFQFLNSDGRAIQAVTEFDLVLADEDNVTSKRAITLVPLEDRPPELEVSLDAIRKVGNQFLATAKAEIPFSRDSKARDDQGLARVEFSFRYMETETVTQSGNRVTFVFPLFLSTPLMPSLGDAIQRGVCLQEYIPLTKAQNRYTPESFQLVPAFVDDFSSRTRDNKWSEEQLKQRLLKSANASEDGVIIKQFEFKEANETNTFDLRKYLPNLEEKDERVAQKSYLLSLNLQAVDTNVDTGPKSVQNKEPFLIKLVSEGELLAEISREEAALGLKLDDAIRRLEDFLVKYGNIVTRVPTHKEKDDFLPDQSRAGELAESLTKAKIITTEVADAYARIAREYRYNRFNDNLISKLSQKIVEPLQGVARQTFPAAEESYQAFANDILNSKVPTPEITQTARQKVAEALSQLKQIRSEMGGISGIQQAIILLQKIIEGQDKDIKRMLKNMLESKQSALYNLVLTPQPNFTIEAGKKAKLRVAVVIPALFLGEPSVTIELPPTGDLKAAKVVKFSEDASEFFVEIEAGTEKGTFPVKLTPVKGASVTVPVIVK